MTHVAEAVSQTAFKRASFRPDNPRILLSTILDEMPDATEDDWRDEFWKRSQDDDRYLRSVVNWWLDNNIDAATKERSGTSHSPRSSNAAELAQKLERHIAKIKLLDMVMPNGKQLRNCTGAECGEFGGWFAALGLKVGKRFEVGAKISEASIQAFYASHMAKDAPA